MTTQSETDLNTQFAAISGRTTDDMRAMLIGPDYISRKYTVNKTLVYLGSYSGSLVSFGWPGILANETVDLGFTRVYIDSAAQRYYNSNAGSISGSTTQPNRISSASVNFAAKTGYPRSGTVPCDVIVGDWVRVTGVNGTVTAKVADIVGDSINPTLDATPDAAVTNKATQAGGVGSYVRTSGTGTAVAALPAVSNATNYNGGAVGLTGDTYYMQVTDATNASGIAGTWVGLKIKVWSLSGLDYTSTSYQEITTAAPGVEFTIGSLGAKVKLSHGVSGNDFVVGDLFTLVVSQAYTVPTVAASGTYTGPSDTTYVIKVTKGGTFATGLITVTTTTGVDSNASLNKTFTSAVANLIGQYGISATLTGTQLMLGDSWTTAVTAGTAYNSAVTGRLGTLVLDTSLSALQAAETTMTLELGVLSDIEVVKNQAGHAPSTNWTPTASLITLNAGAYSTNSRTGATELPIVAGTAYATYRALRTSLANTVHTVVSADDLTALGMPGDDADNVLAYALRRAFIADTAASVRFIATSADSLVGYQAAFPYLLERTDYHQVVPLTNDATILSAVKTGLIDVRNAAGVPTGMFAGLSLATTSNIVKLTSGGSIRTATVTDDPLVSGTQYTLVTDATGVFVTAGARAGDKLRIEYSSDGFGNETYNTYTVASVSSNQAIRLVSGPALAIGSAVRYELWRDLTAAEQASDYDARAAAFANSLVKVVFPANPGRGGVKVANYYLAAALAGRREACAPHQSLRNLQLSDWDDMSETAITFVGQDSLLTHCYLVSQLWTGEVYIKVANTTDSTSIASREDSISHNLASITKFFDAVLAPLEGKVNLVDKALTKIRGLVINGANYLKTATDIDFLGPQIIAVEIVSVIQDPIIRDQLDVTLTVTLPAPLNSVKYTITVTI